MVRIGFPFDYGDTKNTDYEIKLVKKPISFFSKFEFFINFWIF
jgi:hypothetical protein